MSEIKATMEIKKGEKMDKAKFLWIVIFLLIIISCSNTNSIKDISKSNYPQWWEIQDSSDLIYTFGVGIGGSESSSKEEAYSNATMMYPQYIEPYLNKMMNTFLKESKRSEPILQRLASFVCVDISINQYDFLESKQHRYPTKDGDVICYIRLSIDKSEVLNRLKNKIIEEEALYNTFKGSSSAQKLLFGEKKEANKHTSEKNIAFQNKKKIKQTFPPDLYVENLKFSEPSRNKALDGLEKGSIQFDIVNKGRGNAYDIEVDITPLTSSKNLSFKTKTEIKEVLKKDSNKISIPITADIDVEDLFREFRIEVTESNGFDADPAKISFETLAFASPNLKVEQIAIDDNEDAEGEGFSYGNGNSIIEPNESIEVTAYVQNFGEGVASNVKAKVILTSYNRDFTYPDEDKIFNLGDIESGDFRKIDFYFYTSRRYAEKNIPLSIELSESTKKFGKTADLGLKLGNRTKNIVDVQVAKIQTKKKAKMKELDNVVVLSDVDKDIPKTNIDGKNTLAIIIGIEDYKYAPTVDFASNDARVFYQYSKSVFGIPERNIYYRINDGATSGEFNKIFAEDGWIARRLKKDQTDVIVYYSGHGAPDTKSKKGYLIPHDIDPNYANTGVSLDFIYSSLSKLQAKSVTLFIDACFSGESRSEEMLIAGIRPISVKIKNPILTTENMAVFSASTGEQYSSAYPEKQHGLFTYFLLKGLKGKAKGSDKKITLDELQNYIYENVSDTAGYLDKEQTPTFIGKDKNRILIDY